MKVVIAFGGGWGSRYLVIDAAHAAVAATLLAHGRLYESDGDTPDGKHYKLDRKCELSITYATDAQFDELPEAVIAARKQYDDANNARWAAERKANTLQEQLNTLHAQFATLQQQVTCTLAEPEATTTGDAAGEEE